MENKLYLRYIDNIKENKLDFVTRGYVCYIILVLAVILMSALGFLLTFALYINEPTKMIIVIFFNIMASLFIVSLPLYRLVYVVNANEFQNAIIANSLKALTEFCLITRENLTLVYKDNRFDSIFKLKKENYSSNDWLEVFDGESKKIIKNAISGKYNINFDFLDLSISVIKLSRPMNYYLVTATTKNLATIYNTLFEQRGIAIYTTHNNKLISYNKPFESLVNHLGRQITEIENSESELEQTIEEAEKSLNISKSGVSYLQTFGNKATCHMITSTFFDFDEILNAPIPIAHINHHGKILRLNNSFIKNYNITFEGQYISEILNENLDAYFAHDNDKELSIINVSLNQSSTFIKLFLKKSSNGFIGYFIDYSEAKQLEDGLIHSQKLGAVGQLAGGISHDFNNILTAIIGFCDLILLEHCPTESLYDDIMYIKQSAGKGQNLVKQILAFSCKQKLNEKVVCANELIVSIEKFIKCLLGNSISLNIDYGIDLWLMKVDINQLEQVLINLVINSKDAIGVNNGLIKIKTQNFTIEDNFTIQTGTIEKEIPKGDYIMIQVEDNGPGIKPEILDKIFDPFFSTKEVGKGTGLGLATVYGIITQMHGYIYVETELEHYTRFNLILPRSLDRPTMLRQEKNTNNLQCIKDKKILLIEDEPLIRNLLKRGLENKGYAITVVEGPEEVTEDFLKENDDIDMVISDVIMPHISGPEIVEQIMKKIPTIKVIFISGYSKDKINNLKYSFDFISKPFNFNDLVNKIQANL